MPFLATLNLSNLINFMLFLATLFIAVITFYSLKREHGATLFFEYNKRFADIRWQLPSDILSNCFDPNKLKDEDLMNYMRQYFILCSEEFYLKKRKRWIERKLWKEWERAIKYYMGKPAFRKAWREVRNENIYYKGFVPFMDTLAGIRETNTEDD